MDAKEFGQYLKTLRKSRHLTLVQLGEMIGVSNPYLSQLENGLKGIPGTGFLLKFADAVDVNSLELMRDAGIHDLVDKIELQMKKDPTPPNAFPDRTPDLKYSIERSSQRGNLRYNGHLLTKEEGQRLLVVIESMFPQYANPAEEE